MPDYFFIFFLIKFKYARVIVCVLVFILSSIQCTYNIFACVCVFVYDYCYSMCYCACVCVCLYVITATLF